MRKKAISPLIATVLLIGFTIVLAALIIQWGGGLFRQTTEETGVTAKAQMLCSTGIKFEITSATATVTGAEAKIKITNNADQPIAGIFVRFNLEGGDVVTEQTKDSATDVISVFGSKEYTLTVPAATPSKKVITIDIIPKVTSEGGKVVTCPIEAAKSITPTVATAPPPA